MPISADASILAVAGKDSGCRSLGLRRGGRTGDRRGPPGRGCERLVQRRAARRDSDTITVGPGQQSAGQRLGARGFGHPVQIGASVSVGHNAVVHGCTIGDASLIGMGSTILSGA